MKRQDFRTSALVLGLLSASCGGGNVPADRKYVKVAVVYTAKPALYRGSDGNVAGFLFDLEAAVGRRLGREFKFEVTSFENIITGVQGNKFDVGSGIDATAARQQIVDIVPFYQGGYTLLGLASGRRFGPAMNDLCGSLIGVIAGGSDGPELETQSRRCESDGRKPLRLLRYSSDAGALLALKSGKVDAMTGFSWYVPPPGTAATGPIFAVKQTGVAVRKGSPLAGQIAVALRSMIADGTYGKILDKYGLRSLALAKVEINPAGYQPVKLQ